MKMCGETELVLTRPRTLQLVLRKRGCLNQSVKKLWWLCERSQRNMLSIGDVGLRRELQSILTMYLATLLNGYSSGFSAVAVPGIKEEMERRWRLGAEWSTAVIRDYVRLYSLPFAGSLCHL